MHMHCSPLAIAVALLFGAAQVLAAPAESDMAPADAQLKALYWNGHEALKQADWNAALERFRELETRLRRSEPAAVDASLYWQAYALQKARRSAEARATVERLQREFPDSRWNDEANVLVRAGTVPSGMPLGDDDELAEIAVEGLLSAPPERAVPLLRKVLDGDHPVRIKKRALFVLSQMDDAAAMDIVIALARAVDGPLVGEAIRMLGISGDARAMDALSELYRSQSDPMLRRRVLDAWLVADRKDLVLQVARNESDPQTREHAIHQLGAMGAMQELSALLQSGLDADARLDVVHALGIAGDETTLAEIAGNDADPSIRVAAMHSLGVAGAGEQLVALYASAATPDLREAVLQGLLITGDGERLVELYRRAGTVDEKKAILRVLSVIGDDAALQAIESALNP